ncbi:unnamed protein product [Cylindrotheca closterium]|uniref:Peroxiredoxin-like 2A n=1 Tax=Cylindrotheca closterium TaxID=2856 RepID=A0AAD2CE12_9STRA|nr:unnamed protein product [Cylindrotheca closterium]
MGRSRRSKSTEKEEEDNSMEPNDGDAVVSLSKSRKSTFRDRWRKISGGGSNGNEWMNGCGGATPNTDDSDELGEIIGPPVLTIEVDPTKEIDLNLRVRQKTQSQMSQEFASAAREAVKLQMKELRTEDEENDECVGNACQQERVADADADASDPVDGSNGSSRDSGEMKDAFLEVSERSQRSLPPPYMNPTILLESFGTAKVQEIRLHKSGDPTLGEKVQARDLVFRHSGTSGCLVFVIRRPGCLLCREQALYLKFLFQNYPDETKGFTIVGVVKEFCDKSGGEKLQAFHDKYFPFPLYLDIDKAAYKALGNRRAGLGAALKILNPFSDTSKRLKRNQIQGNLMGEGFLQGGIIIYHKHGIAAYKYEEETGLELPVADIVKGLRSVRRDDFSSPTLSAEQDEEEGSSRSTGMPESRKSEGDKNHTSHRHHQALDMSIRTVG